MRRLQRYVEGLCRAGAFLAALFMGLTVTLIVMEIGLRTFFSTSTMVTAEYSGYFLVATVSLGLAYTMHHRGHIRITLIYDRLPAWIRHKLDLAAALVALGICGFAIYYSVLMVYDNYSMGMTADTVAETPLWIPEAAVPAGLILFFLELAAFFLRRLNDR
ncbi:MAG: TRAP transporter small permease [Desulfohalobiaceae bacterium]